jgi:hypothetical protein
LKRWAVDAIGGGSGGVVLLADDNGVAGVEEQESGGASSFFCITAMEDQEFELLDAAKRKFCSK